MTHPNEARAVAAPEVLIGRCVTCRRAFRHDGGLTTAPWCDCRTAEGHPQTAIRWKLLKATSSAKGCNARCEGSTSPLCVCACAGRHHGATWAATAGRLGSAEAVTAGMPLGETRHVLADALDQCVRDLQRVQR